MRFALLGNHPDGLEFACALIESGSHELICYSTNVAAGYEKRFGGRARLVPDLEEILADPAVELVVVAGSAANRPTQLRRALQSERHVACVYPPDDSPDIAHEASMIQGDTRKVLFPILPDVLHPAVQEMQRFFEASLNEAIVRAEIHAAALKGSEVNALCFPTWDVLRGLGGEIAEVVGLARSETVVGDEPVLINGRFGPGLLFQVSYVPARGREDWTIVLEKEKNRVELSWPTGPRGPAYLSRWEEGGELQEEAWTAWDPWGELVKMLDEQLALQDGTLLRSVAKHVVPSWRDVIRGLELDDALRRSIKQRRSVVLDYQEGSEEVGFKGTMTLVGCGLLWLLVVALILGKWFPALLWGVAPLLILFLGLQVFRWVIPRKDQTETE